MKTTTLLTAIVLLAVPIAHSAVIMDLEFDIDGRLPSAEQNVVYCTPTGLPESNFYSVSGGQLHQRTFTTDGNFSYLWRDCFETNGALNLDPALDLAMEAGLAIQRVAGIGCYFQAFDRRYRYTAFFVPSGVQVLRAGGLVLIPVNVTNYHTYRFEVPAASGIVRYFVDGSLVLEGCAAVETNYNGFGWGDGVGDPGNGADADWDFVRVSQGPALVSPPPRLSISRSAVQAQVQLAWPLTWPAQLTNYVLDTAPAVSPANWMQFTAVPTLTNGEAVVIADTTNRAGFFRLRCK